MTEVGAMLQRFYSVDATPFVRDVTAGALRAARQRAAEAFGAPGEISGRSAGPPSTPGRGRQPLRGAVSLRSLSL